MSHVSDAELSSDAKGNAPSFARAWDPMLWHHPQYSQLSPCGLTLFDNVYK